MDFGGEWILTGGCGLSTQSLTAFQRSLTTMQIQVAGLLQFAVPLFPTAEVRELPHIATVSAGGEPSLNPHSHPPFPLPHSYLYPGQVWEGAFCQLCVPHSLWLSSSLFLLQKDLLGIQSLLNSSETSLHQLTAMLDCRGLHKVLGD